MSTFIGIGFSQHSNAAQAATEASIQARKQAQQQIFNLVIFFTSIHYCSNEVLRTIRENFKQARIIGCSTAGIIRPERIESQGIAILAIKSSSITFGTGYTKDCLTRGLRESGIRMAENTIKDFGYNRRQAFLFFTDSLMGNTSLMVEGLREALGTTTPILGIGSSDNFRFQKTCQYSRDAILTDSAVGLLMGGEMRLGLGLKHGWNPLGKPRFISKTEGQIIKAIDGKRASLIYEEYLGAEIRNLRSGKLSTMAMLYPLGIYIEKEGEYLLRYILDILEDGSLICQGNVPEQTEVHIMIGNKDSYKKAAIEAAEEVRHSLIGKQPQFFLIIESLSRYKLLGRSALLEIQMVREILGYTTPMLGMYSHGEIGPIKAIDYMGTPYLQNNMMMIIAIL